MLKVIEIEAKTLQEATKKASDILKISEAKIKLEVLKEKKAFLALVEAHFIKQALISI